jgi:hypothetical protein
MMLSYILLKATNPREDLVAAGHRRMTPPPPTARWGAIKRLSSAAMLQPALLLEGGFGHPPVTQEALPFSSWSLSVHVESGLSSRAPRSLSGRGTSAGVSANVDLRSHV